MNGEPHEVASPLTIAALLNQLGVDPRRVAVEHNEYVVKRDRLATTVINEGDEIEIVNFVGGGSESRVAGRVLRVAGRVSQVANQ